MFYKGIKPGVKLFRIIDGCTEVSEVKEEIKSIIWRRERKIFRLIPIIGNWTLEEVSWYQSSKCFASFLSFGRPLVYRNLFYYAGTNFDKVMKKTIKCGMLEI